MRRGGVSRRHCRTAAAVQSCYRPRRRGMAIYVDGVPMTDKVLGLMALAFGGALGWFLFEPVMTGAARQGISIEGIMTIGAILAGLLLGWAVVDLLRR